VKEKKKIEAATKEDSFRF